MLGKKTCHRLEIDHRAGTQGNALGKLLFGRGSRSTLWKTCFTCNHYLALFVVKRTHLHAYVHMQTPFVIENRKISQSNY